MERGEFGKFLSWIEILGSINQQCILSAYSITNAYELIGTLGNNIWLAVQVGYIGSGCMPGIPVKYFTVDDSSKIKCWEPYGRQKWGIRHEIGRHYNPVPGLFRSQQMFTPSRAWTSFIIAIPYPIICYPYGAWRNIAGPVRHIHPGSLPGSRIH